MNNIGASVVIKGNIEAREDLAITGRVEGNIHLEGGALTLAPGSAVLGDITVPSVVVQGNVEGNLAATGRVDLRSGASIAGSITTPTLVVADGAILNCHIEMPPAARRAGTPPALAEKVPVAV